MTLQNRAQIHSLPFNIPQSHAEVAVELVELKPRRNAFVKADSQQLVVIDGVAWVTMNGKDHVIKAGDSCQLVPNNDRYPVCISALGNKSVTYTLK